MVADNVYSRLSHGAIGHNFVILTYNTTISVIATIVVPTVKVRKTRVCFKVLSYLNYYVVVNKLLRQPLGGYPTKVNVLVYILLFVLACSMDTRDLLFNLVGLPSSLCGDGLLYPLKFFNSSFFSTSCFPLLP